MELPKIYAIIIIGTSKEEAGEMKVRISTILFIFLTTLILSRCDNTTSHSGSPASISYSFYYVNTTDGTKTTIKFFNNVGGTGIVDQGVPCQLDDSYETYVSGICDLGTIQQIEWDTGNRTFTINTIGAYYFKDGQIFKATIQTNLKPEPVYTIPDDIKVDGVYEIATNILNIDTTDHGNILINLVSKNVFIDPEEGGDTFTYKDAYEIFYDGQLIHYLIKSGSRYFLCDPELAQCQQIDIDPLDIVYTFSKYLYYFTEIDGEEILYYYDTTTNKKGPVLYNGNPFTQEPWTYYFIDDAFPNHLVVTEQNTNDDTTSFYFLEDDKLTLYKTLHLNDNQDAYMLSPDFNSYFIYEIEDDDQDTTEFCMDSLTNPAEENCPQSIYTIDSSDPDYMFVNDILFIGGFNKYVEIKPDATPVTTGYDFAPEDNSTPPSGDVIMVLLLKGMTPNNTARIELGVVTLDGKFYSVDETLRKSQPVSLGIEKVENLLLNWPIGFGAGSCTVFMIINSHSDNTFDFYVYGFNGFSAVLLEKNVGLDIRNIKSLPYLLAGW